MGEGIVIINVHPLLSRPAPPLFLRNNQPFAFLLPLLRLFVILSKSFSVQWEKSCIHELFLSPSQKSTSTGEQVVFGWIWSRTLYGCYGNFVYFIYFNGLFIVPQSTCLCVLKMIILYNLIFYVSMFSVLVPSFWYAFPYPAWGKRNFRCMPTYLNLVLLLHAT